MKSLTIMLAVSLVAAAPQAAGDRAKIQGGWYEQRTNNNGSEIGIQSGPDPDADFKADGRLWLYGQDIARYAMDESKKTIDIITEKGFAAGTTAPGIYKLEGDSLTVCHTQPPGQRPTDFAPGAGKFLSVYRRTPIPRAAAPKGELHGGWELVEKTEGGIKRKIVGKSLLSFNYNVFARDEFGALWWLRRVRRERAAEDDRLDPHGGRFPGRRASHWDLQGRGRHAHEL